MREKFPFSGQGEELLKQLTKHFWIIRRRKWLARSLKALAVLAGTCVVAMGVVTGYMYYVAWGLTDSSGRPFDWEKLRRGDYKKSSVVLSEDNEPIGRFFYEIRDPVAFPEIPKLLVNGFVAAEDQRFYSNIGFDWRATIRAGGADFLHAMGYSYGQQSGASTIKQQLARLLYADESDDFKRRDRSLRRKIREARVAMQLNRRYSKEQLMEGYLNIIYFGHSVNGVVEAARYYFGKNIRKDALTAQEAAILVALNKSPEKYCPIFHEPTAPEGPAREKQLAMEITRTARARDRYNWVLWRMRNDGYIDEKTYHASIFSLNEPLRLAFVKVTPLKDNDFEYGSRFAKELLLTNGFDDRQLTSESGLQIHTTIDSHIQKIISEQLRAHLAMLNSELPEDMEKLNGAAVVLDLKTSRILALTGGGDFFQSPFDRAMGVRSAGSASKLIVYSSYLRLMHASYDDVLPNVPFSMVSRVDAKGHALKRWSPGNFQEKNPVPYGLRRIDEVFPRSVNLPALHAARKIGMTSPGGVVETAHRFGIWGTPGVIRDPTGKAVLRVLGAKEPFKDGIDPYLPTAIAINANLIEIVGAFAVTGRRGMYLPPSMIRDVYDAEGKMVYESHIPEPVQVEDAEVSRKITVLLRAVTKYGTLKISMKDIRQEVGCKTGTSHKANDFNVVCITPDLVLALRIGYDHPRPISLPLYMKRVSGDSSLYVSAGWVGGPLMRDMLDTIYEMRPIVQFPADTEEDLATIVKRNM